MKRRKFIQTTGTALSLPVLLNGMPLSSLPKSSAFRSLNDDNDRVLVIVQLTGGNDGLNMIIPVDQYDQLANVRSNIILPPGSLLPVTDTVAFHPSMTGLKSMYENARLCVVQSAGYPNQNRSHFRSTDIWSSGSPAEETWRTGWVGRHFDARVEGFPSGFPNTEYPDPFAITMGSVVSETCQGTAANYSMTLNDPFTLTPLTEGAPGTAPDTPYGHELSFLRTAISQTNAYSEVITAAAAAGANAVDYPGDNPLAAQLKSVALLISGGMRTKIYVVNIGGFDTHANQVEAGNPSTGTHAELLGRLSEAVAAFQADIDAQGLGNRVLGMTFSEFGRRIRANDSLGTDHGTAAPLLLFGGCVNAQILGDNPVIPADPDVNEGVPMQHDFRDVYGSVLMDWFEVEEADVRTLLHQDFNYLPIVQPCEGTVSTHTPTKLAEEIKLSAAPNPFRRQTSVRFVSGNEWGQLSAFDSRGALVQHIFSQRLRAGEHRFDWDASGLLPGVYILRLQLEGRQQTSRVVLY